MEKNRRQGMSQTMAANETTYPSTCWECSTTCGMLLKVSAGRVVKVTPNPDHPYSKGAFCVKGIRALPELTYGTDRVLHPLRRKGARGGGAWVRISWDEALNEMAERFASIAAEFGATALAGAVSGAFFSRGAIVALLMRSMGSPNWMINQDLCGGCRAVSDRLTGLAVTNGEDIDKAACALIVGRNPSAADPVQWMALKRARKRGARIVVIDPARIPVADIADLWLSPRPGTDAAVALAMSYVLISENLYDHDFVAHWCHGFDAFAERSAQYPPARVEELSGVPATDIEKAARLFAEGPSAFISGHGIDAFSAGVQTFRAYHCLLAISGNLDRPGGNRRLKKPVGFHTYLDLLHDPQFRLPADVEKLTIGAERFPLWAGPKGWQTACHNPSVIAAMLTGNPYPVRAAYVSGVNIVVTYPDTPKTIKALQSLDFLAVATQTMTPTAELADIVLPKTTTLEEEEVSLQVGGPGVQFTRAAVAPRDEALSDFEIAKGLLARMEARGALAADFLPWPTKRAFNEFLLGESGISMETLMAEGYAEFPYALGDFENQTFDTPTGKVELYSETLADLGLEPLPDYVPTRTDRQAAKGRAEFPLVLLTGAREKTYHHSRFREQAWARKVSPDPEIEVHPETAAGHGLTDGEWANVETPGGPGRCRLRVKVTETVPPGVVRTGMGWWLPEAAAPERGALDININAAMTYDGPWDPMSGSADTRGLPCRLTRVDALGGARAAAY